MTENGVATDDDTRRIASVKRAMAGIARCIRDKIDARGYFYWSTFDKFEWLFGYHPKFGLIAIDRETRRRTVKPSAEWLGRIARGAGRERRGMHEGRGLRTHLVIRVNRIIEIARCEAREACFRRHSACDRFGKSKRTETQTARFRQSR